MSMYVYSLIEVCVDGKWELFKYYTTDRNIKTDAEGNYPEDVKIVKTNSDLTLVEHAYVVNDTYLYQDLLCKYVASYVGLPNDMSSEAYEEHMRLDDPSIPEYFTLDMLRLYKNNLNDEYKEALNGLQGNSLNTKLEYVIKKLEGIKVKPYNFDNYVCESDLNCIREKYQCLTIEYNRIKMMVETEYGYVPDENIRVIWLIR